MTLIVPSVKKGNGTGHLKRSMTLASLAGERALYLDLGQEEREELHRRFLLLDSLAVYGPEDRDKLIHLPLERILIDRRETTREEWIKWESLAPVILLDEGGEARSYGSFVIDSLPSLDKRLANRQALSYLNIPVAEASEVRKKGSVLITFGGEDPAGLSRPVWEKLLEAGYDPSSLGVVKGPLMAGLDPPADIKVHNNPETLQPLFSQYETVVTSFGLTPYEAAGAGCRVLLINPTDYHEKLSHLEDFPSAGVGPDAAGKLIPLVLSAGYEEFNRQRLDGTGLSELLDSLGNGASAFCPFCGQENNKVIGRFQIKSYYLCSRCANYYMVNWQEEEEVYDRDYFFGRYKAQYGKTYLEDFDNIKKVSLGRLKEIEKLIPRAKGALLTDLGCAFGPFLAAAGEKEFSCRGVEINRYGAQWVEENLNIPVIVGSLTDEQVWSRLIKEKSRIITLWYVIEHLPDQVELLKRLHDALEPGGVLAFGTPSGRGISARRCLMSFLGRSPGDHFVIYTPRGAARILRAYGFKALKIKSVGHHPDRFGSWVGKKGSFSYNIVMRLSRIFSLGDSIEVYARKMTD